MENIAEQLGRKEWIAAAIEAASEGGIDNVRVERLARRLRVTKGSFYWHFKDRNALLQALLEAWQDMQTTAVIDNVEAVGGQPREILANVISHIGGMNVGLEIALRQWAATDDEVYKTIVRIDEVRISHLQSIIARAGIPAERARERAMLLYYAFIGEAAFGRPIAPEDRATRMRGIQEMIFSWP
ncbi:MAG: TetR/AcrR family transcriptional regulator [Hyphomicrobiales bacterium]|nr:TetR/AcrR family transcriptional regulator [Hyphomicrobiales bacterium]MCC2108600.1 TetR/AcrR family transcriptional regulator [Hyphomicrobiales bacterium]